MTLTEQIAQTAESCRGALASAELCGIGRVLPALASPKACFELLSGFDGGEADRAAIEQRRAALADSEGGGPGALERYLLAQSSLEALSQLEGWAVDDSVKRLCCKEFAFFANPPQAWRERMTAGEVRFKEMAKIATGRRFPAGQMHWETSGVPRAQMANCAARSLSATSRALRRLGGVAPLWELHVNARRKNPLVMLKSEADRCYYRVAQSLALQEPIRGVMTASWFYDPQVRDVTPHIAWMRDDLEAYGAVLIDAGPAAEDAGFLTGSDARRELYRTGKYRPRIILALWARQDVLAWAEAHPAYADAV